MRVHRIFALILIIGADICALHADKGNLVRSLQEVETHEAYWGTWEDISGKKGTYDIELVENESEPHTFRFQPSGISLTIGHFRNDTLILDNGTIVYWCHLSNDTLTYSAYSKGVKEMKFIRK